MNTTHETLQATRTGTERLQVVATVTLEEALRALGLSEPIPAVSRATTL